MAAGTHEAWIEWEADGGFVAGDYRRTHIWRFDGGAEVSASASPHIVPEPQSDPAAVDPEEALVASVSSCHMLWFLSVARDAGFDVARYSDRAEGTLARDRDGRIAITRIDLAPVIEFAGRQPAPAEIAALHEAAHDRCFIANSFAASSPIR